MSTTETETESVLSLDEAIEAGAYYLEEVSKWADRYCVGVDEYGDGISAYFCRDCGLEVSDADEGCEHCGFGQPVEDEDEEEEEELAA